MKDVSFWEINTNGYSMALLFVGKTSCPICSQTIRSNKEAFCFPAFVNNANDPMDFYNDRCFHVQCLSVSPDAEEAKSYIRLIKEKLRPGNIVCDISGKKISDPDNCIFLGLLTPNENEELNKYNFLVFDKDSILVWKEKEEFLRCIGDFKESGKWKDRVGDYLGWIMNTFRCPNVDGKE